MRQTSPPDAAEIEYRSKGANEANDVAIVTKTRASTTKIAESTKSSAPADTVA